MGSITLAQAQRLARSPLMQGVIQEILTVDATWSLLPWVEAPGGQLIYNRELTASGVSWHAVGDSANRTQATVTTITANIYAMEGTAEVEQHLQAIYNQPNDQMATQVLLKIKAAYREFQKRIILGDSANNQPDGLRKLTVSGQYVTSAATTGQNFSCALLDNVLGKVVASNGRVDALFMGLREIKAVRKLARMLPGANWGTMQLPNPSDPSRPLNLTTYADIPILRNDWITATETFGGQANKSRIWAVSFEPLVGFTGIRPTGIDKMVSVGPEFYDKNTPSAFRRAWVLAGTALYCTQAVAGANNINATVVTA